jgi:hypothetical protein
MRKTGEQTHSYREYALQYGSALHFFADSLREFRLVASFDTTNPFQLTRDLCSEYYPEKDRATCPSKLHGAFDESNVHSFRGGCIL